ncbi:hypothetical protein ICL16_42850 [Iningainema sp. BLCCT55]|uniref:Uncharacterized protein n=1 Tax=Iningainema tapete BLCC-T55 TaxID=2748662 RepID=A0A8J6XKJ6_9CYAN|nr:hypothetical protein [Iningainema tapete]MBD2778610.1 hypothetical protein [Iningainema tapete BLCC-T55]
MVQSILEKLFLPNACLHSGFWHICRMTIHAFDTLLARVLAIYNQHIAWTLLGSVRKILPQMCSLTYG